MRALWRTEPQGILSAEVHDCRLIVQAPERIGGSVRFMVLRRGPLDKAEYLIGSGNEDAVSAAMEAAEEMAERFTKRGLSWSVRLE